MAETAKTDLRVASEAWHTARVKTNKAREVLAQLEKAESQAAGGIKTALPPGVNAFRFRDEYGDTVLKVRQIKGGAGYRVTMPDNAEELPEA